MKQDKENLITGLIVGILCVGGLVTYGLLRPIQPIPKYICDQKWFIERRFGNDIEVSTSLSATLEIAGDSRVYKKEVCNF